MFLIYSQTLFAESHLVSISQNWEFREVGTEKWYPSTVPGTVHTDLLANNLIEDPFKDNNEKKQQWIENKDWEYKTTFYVSKEQLLKKHHELNFKGLDTYADVYLNGQLILKANNMFRSWQVDVTHQLKLTNSLRIVFTSPIIENTEKAKEYLPLPGGSDTTQFPVAPFTRKAAYHFGWDWAPRFVTCGIWNDIILNSWSEFRIMDYTISTISLNKNVAKLRCEVIIEADKKQKVELTLVDFAIKNTKIEIGRNSYFIDFEIENPKLWWPNGSGEPHLYGIDVNVESQNNFDIKSGWHGIRTIDLVNEPDSIGTSFYFKVNNTPIFMKGANYVPQDVFLPRVKREDYERLIKQVHDAGMNMLRVWGGGVYERNYFYDLCDNYGILVWQDFMFAGTMYPIDDNAFRENVKEEIKEQVKRISKHACLALWCGNNEIEVAWKNWGWQKQYEYSKDDSLQLWRGYSFLFEAGIPLILKELDGKTPYVTTSPQSNWGTPENFNHGSMHYWGVWHGDDDFSGYKTNVGRFMVEWGFQSFPDYELLAEYVSPEFLRLDSEVMKNRQKSYVGNTKILEFDKLYRVDSSALNFHEFVSASQWTQSLGYMLAIKAHMKDQPHCMGTLLWQLNDCWPGPSWSIINYDGKPKPVYWEVKELFKE